MSATVATREIRWHASEVKFVVDEDLAERIRRRARDLLAADPWASGPTADQYRITSLYFDTAEMDVYHRRRSYRRAKYRIRRYGEGGVAFLERKLRTPDVLSKRRTAVPTAELDRLDADGVDRHWAGRWFIERVRARRLSVVCRVSYLRTARVGTTDSGPIRLTVDRDLEAAAVDAARFDDQADSLPIATASIVEMKFRAAMPAVFKSLVEEFSLTPTRVSKYRLGAEATRPGLLALGASPPDEAEPHA